MLNTCMSIYKELKICRKYRHNLLNIENSAWDNNQIKTKKDFFIIKQSGFFADNTEFLNLPF